MKKLLLLAALVMVFASCEKEETAVKNGEAVVTLKVVDQNFTKAMTGAPTADTKIVWGDPEQAKVNFSSSSVNIDDEMVAKADLTKAEGYVIKNVMNPIKMSVSINNGLASYTNLDPFTSLAAAAMHSYGETINFPDDQTGKTIEGLKVKNATVNVKIPVARLEVGNIHFHNEGTVFSAITLADVFVDGAPVKDVEVKYTENEDAAKAGYNKVTRPENVADWSDYTAKRGTVLVQNVAAADFQSGANHYPYDTFNEGCYAFNIFGQDGSAAKTSLPNIKFHFTGCAMIDGKCEAEQFAFVTKYLDVNNGNAEITSFQPGYIYQIKEVEIFDKNLTGEINGGDKYAIVAKVSVQDWTIVETGVELYE